MNITYELFFDLYVLLIHNDDEDGRISSLIKETIEIYEENRFTVRDEQLISFFIKLIKETEELKLKFNKNKADILRIFHKYKKDMILIDSPDVREALENVVKNQVTLNSLINLFDKASNFIIWYKTNRAISKMYVNLKKVSSTTNPLTQKNHLASIYNSINELKEDLKDSSGPSTKFVERINFSIKTDITQAINRFDDRRIKGILKTGWQGLNNMLGPRKGIALGESIFFCGLPHDFKSGMLMSMAKWIVEYNPPPKAIDGKKPMILFISLENEAFENMMWWFKQIYIVITSKAPSDDISNDEIVDFIYNYFESKDYVFVVERYLPESFCYDDLVSLYEMYTNSGYKIVATIMDYLSKMNLGSKSSFNSNNSRNDLLIYNLFSRVCNFMKSNGTTFISAHQLNRKASDIVASGIPYPVKRFNGSHLALSQDVEREPDVLIYIHKEINRDGVSYLTLKWGKHRYVDDTPESHKFVCYPFEASGIKDDINTEYMGVKDIYNNTPVSKEDSQKNEVNEMLEQDVF